MGNSTFTVYNNCNVPVTIQTIDAGVSEFDMKKLQNIPVGGNSGQIDYKPSVSARITYNGTTEYLPLVYGARTDYQTTLINSDCILIRGRSITIQPCLKLRNIKGDF